MKVNNLFKRSFHFLSGPLRSSWRKMGGNPTIYQHFLTHGYNVLNVKAIDTKTEERRKIKHGVGVRTRLFTQKTDSKLAIIKGRRAILNRIAVCVSSCVRFPTK